MKRILTSILRGAAAGAALNSAIYVFWGLALFVGVPLPGTGAWTGALIAALLHLPWKRAFLAITLGVLIAGVLVSLVSLGILHTFAGG